VSAHEHNRLSTEDLLNASPDSREHDIENHDIENDGVERDGLRDGAYDGDIDNEGLRGGAHAETTGLDRDPELDRDADLNGEPEIDRDAELAPDEELAPDGGITADTEVSPAAETHDDLPASGVATDTTTTDVPATDVAAANGKPVAAPRTQTNEGAAPLFDTGEVEQFRTQWKELQSTFVDSPQDAVREADELVAEIMQNLARTFAEHKRTLEDQWSRGDEVQTEDLRLALRQYRSFFNQLLSV
jgi:hypothetical protein